MTGTVDWANISNEEREKLIKRIIEKNFNTIQGGLAFLEITKIALEKYLEKKERLENGKRK